MTAVVVLVGMLVFLVQLNGRLAAALLVFWALAGLALPLVVRLLSREPGAELVSRRAALQAALVDGIQGQADLLAFGRQRQTLESIRQIGTSLAGAQQRLAWINGLQTAFSGFLSHLGMWVVLVLAIPLVRSGQLDGVLLAVVVLASLASFEAVAPLPLAAQVLEGSLAAARRLFDLADRTPAVQDVPAALPPPPGALLEVQGLTFRYQPDLPPALQDVSFRLEPGRRLAIVGPSGAGKSTLAGLLLRFWDYQAGEIRLGGQDVRQTAGGWRTRHVWSDLAVDLFIRRDPAPEPAAGEAWRRPGAGCGGSAGGPVG